MSEKQFPVFKNFVSRSLASVSVKFRKSMEMFLDFFLLTPPMKMEQKECPEMSAHTIQTPGIHPKERIQPVEI